jgi:GDP-4-dehydro-6-deoxy-D-mannose reductase
MRLLITGAAGFVGGHLVEYLRREHPAVEVQALVRPHGGVHVEPAPGVRVFEADLDDAAAVTSVVEAARPDRVVHLAGQSSVHHSWIDPGATLRTNVLGIVHLVAALRRLETRVRLLVVGSAEEYGPVSAADLPVREEHPRRPVSPYAVSKVAQGHLALEHAAASHVEVVRTRTFHHTGPRRGEVFAESSFARQVAEVEACLREGVLRVGNLEAVRDYSDVRDVVRAYWLLLDAGSPGEVYNVCSGSGVKIGDLLERLIAGAGVRVEVRQDPDRLRPSDLPALVGDPSRLKVATGWEPRFGLDRTLDDLLDYWRDRVRLSSRSIEGAH